MQVLEYFRPPNGIRQRRPWAKIMSMIMSSVALLCYGCECPTAGQVRCVGAGCVDLDSSDTNCGACGNECAPDESCVGGECVCAGAICNGECIDPLSDARHCGGCNMQCPGGFVCDFGTCIDATGGPGPSDPDLGTGAPGEFATFTCVCLSEQCSETYKATFVGCFPPSAPDDVDPRTLTAYCGIEGERIISRLGAGNTSCGPDPGVEFTGEPCFNPGDVGSVTLLASECSLVMPDAGPPDAGPPAP
jgi:hypothetical protein